MRTHAPAPKAARGRRRDSSESLASAESAPVAAGGRDAVQHAIALGHRLDRIDVEAPVQRYGVVQRNGDDKGFISKAKPDKREFGSTFFQRHIADGAEYNSYDKMAELVIGRMKGRSSSTQASGTNTVIFMTSYQMAVFLAQNHNYLGTDSQGREAFESTTQFPAAEIDTSANLKIYSAAKFQYAGYVDESGLLTITHFGGVTSGSVALSQKLGGTRTTFE